MNDLGQKMGLLLSENWRWPWIIGIMGTNESWTILQRQCASVGPMVAPNSRWKALHHIGTNQVRRNES